MGKTDKRTQVGDRIEGTVQTTGTVGGGAKVALVVFLQPWVDGNGRVQRRELRVEVPMKSLASATRAASRWDNESVALTVTKSWAASGNRLEGARAERLSAVKRGEGSGTVTPSRVVEDRLLGQLELDPGSNSLVAHRRTARFDYEVLIQTGDLGDETQVAQDIERAKQRLRAVERGVARLREAASEKLLATYNEVWNDGSQSISAAQFRRALKISTIHIAPGRTTVHLSCGDMFGEHGVELRLTPRGSVSEILVA